MENPAKPKFKNKSERNAGVKTEAMQIFEGKQIITFRPDDMSSEDYRLIREGQNRVIKALFPKAPNRKLVGLISPHKPLLRSVKGFSKPPTQRKAN